MKIQCEHCLSYNTLDVISEDLDCEAFECWNCQQRSFVSWQGLFHYMLRTNSGEIEAYQDLNTYKPKIVNGYI